VNGLSSIQAFTNGVPTPTLNLSSVGGLQISTDTNLLYSNGRCRV
jgi:hypothetical protein